VHRFREVKRFFRDNALTLVLLGVFAAAVSGQALTGHRVDSAERRQHDQPARSLGAYLGSGAFLEALFENWESEFLEMSALIWLASFLRQRGAADSKPARKEREDFPARPPRDAPWPVRRGGWVLAVYSRSLTLALVALFLFCFGLHAVHGYRKHAEEQRMHGEAPGTLLEFASGPEFWFESFQNWQSEFFGVAVMGLLSIWLRQRGSPHSKPVAAPSRQTGT